MKIFKTIIAAGLLCPAAFVSSPSISATPASVNPVVLVEPESDDPTSQPPVVLIIGFGTDETDAFTALVKQLDEDCLLLKVDEMPDADILDSIFNDFGGDSERIYIIVNGLDIPDDLNVSAAVIANGGGELGSDYTFPILRINGNPSEMGLDLFRNLLEN